MCFLKARMPMPRIKAIIVTHDHTDHIKAVGPLSIEFRIPVYASILGIVSP